jgi:phosphate acetyltransferase
MWIDYVREKAQHSRKKILLPEGNDKRIEEAAQIIRENNIAEVTVLTSQIKEAAEMVAGGAYDGMVAGAVNTTADVVRSAIKKIGTNPEVPVVSSFFLMESDNKYIGEEGGILFADCAVVPNPDSAKLANIAYATAQSARNILGWEPRVAFLSFSTKGSAKHETIDKVTEAVEKLRAKSPDFIFDGELQLDTAIIPEVASHKDADGVLKGRANILIFPDLNSANIGYKIAQRIGGMRAIGPILQGFKKPVNDLSRGCSVDDIVDVTAFTVLQA